MKSWPHAQWPFTLGGKDPSLISRARNELTCVFFVPGAGEGGGDTELFHGLNGAGQFTKGFQVFLAAQ